MIRISLNEGRTAFCGGEPIAGQVEWHLPEPPESAELRLCWFTRGKGTEDSEVVETVTFATPTALDQRSFQFIAPAEPYSFSGKLISLIWALELVFEPGEAFERVEIVIAPERREVVLPVVEAVAANPLPTAALRPHVS